MKMQRAAAIRLCFVSGRCNPCLLLDVLLLTEGGSRTTFRNATGELLLRLDYPGRLLFAITLCISYT